MERHDKKNINQSWKQPEPKKDQLKKALRYNGFWIFLNIILFLISFAWIVLKIIKPYISFDIDAFIGKWIKNQYIQYIFYGVLALGFINLIFLRKNKKKRKIIKNSYCPKCGRPHKYYSENHQFSIFQGTWNFSNTDRTEQYESWSGTFRFHCHYCNTEHVITLNFRTHIGESLTGSDDPRLEREFNTTLAKQFERKKKHAIRINQ